MKDIDKAILKKESTRLMELQAEYFDKMTKNYVKNKNFEGFKNHLEGLAEKALINATNEHIECLKLIKRKDFERCTEIFQKIFENAGKENLYEGLSDDEIELMNQCIDSKKKYEPLVALIEKTEEKIYNAELLLLSIFLMNVSPQLKKDSTKV